MRWIRGRGTNGGVAEACGQDVLGGGERGAQCCGGGGLGVEDMYSEDRRDYLRLAF